MPSLYHVSLADLSQESGAELPLHLLQEWETSDKSPEKEQELLAPYEVRGTVVITDASGLSKLSQELSLLEVMQLIHIPKKTVFDIGISIGGEAMGIWAADNTSMFYPEHIPVEEIVSAMEEVQAALHTSKVQIGIGIHTGVFIKIGNSLLGKEAHFIEEFAENHTEGGEIAISEPTKAHLPTQKLCISKTCALTYPTYTIVPTLQVNLRVSHASPNTYPLPFDKNFYELLEHTPFEDLCTLSLHAYQRTTNIILTKLHLPENISLLEHGLTCALLTFLYKQIAHTHKIDIIKSQGTLHISTSNDPKQALAFAEELRETLSQLSYIHTTALSYGEILLFPLQDGGKDVAGNPVNIASKLAEDSGEEGILIEESVPLPHAKGTELLFHISGVPLKAKKSR